MDISDALILTLGDWQWNASLIGFINIVGKDHVHLYKDTVEFSVDLLEGFEEKYFGYLIRTYEKMLSWHKIVSMMDRLDAYENSEFEHFNLEALKSLNNYIKDVKLYLKSNSYKAAYELVASKVDILSLEKQLTPVKEPKNQQQFENDRLKTIAELRSALEVLREIIAYCASPEGKCYIGAKNVIYTIINNAWNGVSFLNPQTKIKDVYADYKTYFVDTATDYIKQDKRKYKYRCFLCDAPIKDMSNDLSFLNATGFDVARKSSHVWDFQNDIAICPLCKLVYSCLPAGMAYVYDRGIYVNANINIEDAFNINYVIKQRILGNQESGPRSIYLALVGALHRQEHQASQYDFADIQVVRYENGSYRFNILSRKMLEIIVESREDLDRLIKAVFIENGMNVRVHDEVITRIFNNQNLFTLIHRMLYHKLSSPSNCYFHGGHLTSSLRINQQIYMRLGGMKVDNEKENRKRNADIIWAARKAGEGLRTGYKVKEAHHKLPGICYRLLNALKTSNKDMFMDVALNCYLYVKKPVPKVLTSALSNDKDFSTMGYAFVAALIDEPTGERDNTAPQDEQEVSV